MVLHINDAGKEYNSFIYQWIDKSLDKFYIGSHIGSIDDGYMFGGIDIKREYSFRPNDFERVILSFHVVNSNTEIRNIEKEYLLRFDVENNDKFYNRTNESYGGYHKKSVEKRLMDIDENGLNAFQRAAKKMVETRKNSNSYNTAKVKEYETKKSKIADISRKISETLKGSCWINKDGERKYIKPNEVDQYLDNGWKLGIKNLYTFQECKNIANENNISTNKEWKIFARANSLPVNVNRTYHSEWTSWENFLNKKNSKSYNYHDCKNFVKEFEIKTKYEWQQLSSIHKLPYHPNRKYKSEWISWNEFLNN